MGSFSFTYSSKPEVSCEELCNGNRDCRWFVFRKDTIECSLLQLEGKNFQDDPNFVLGWRTEPPPKMTVVTKRPETVLCQATDGVFLGGGGGGAVCKHYMIDDDVFFRWVVLVTLGILDYMFSLLRVTWALVKIVKKNHIWMQQHLPAQTPDWVSPIFKLCASAQS